ncbi:MAG: hypothetical protein ACP5VR_13545 [Acidimicrobiales bacterium]
MAKALGAVPVGGWTAGMVGRRDGALVAMVCAGGYSRRQLAAMKANDTLASAVPDLLERLGHAEAPGACPACALTRWLRVHALLAAQGWRRVRDEFSDIGEIAASTEESHDCQWPLAWPEQASLVAPLFSAIDYHGNIELRLALSTRSMSAIVAERIADGEEPSIRAKQQPGVAKLAKHRPSADEATAMGQASLARLEALDALVDQTDAMAEAVLANFEAGLGRQ